MAEPLHPSDVNNLTNAEKSPGRLRRRIGIKWGKGLLVRKKLREENEKPVTLLCFGDSKGLPVYSYVLSPPPLWAANICTQWLLHTHI